MIKKSTTYTHEYLAKASWRATALTLKVEANTETQAWHRAWGMVSRMMGGDDCLTVKIIGQIR